AEHVGLELATERVPVRVFDRCVGIGEGGHVDEGVDSTELLHRSVHQIPTLGRVGDVGGNGEGAAAEGLDLAGNALQPIDAAGAEGDIGAVTGEGERTRPPNALTGAGDDGDAAL